MKFILVVICCWTVVNATAQELYQPREIKAAFKAGTRSMDGRPGKNYWQNKATYSIDLNVMPPDRYVRGTESITYYNNSNDSLRSLFIKLFLNIHQAGAPRERTASPDYLSEGMTIDKFVLQGKTIQWQPNPGLSTWQYIRLPKAIQAHDSIRVQFDWHYQISLESGREGMIDPTTYFLAYFYPRIAVFDDYAGWDTMDFIDSKEFYSDFNDYNVTIHAPKNFVVWGTGTLQQPANLFQPVILDRVNRSLTSDAVIRVITPDDLKAKNITQQNAVNNWTFKAVNIPDMAFIVSDHFVWDATSTIVDSITKRRATANAVYNDTAADYHHVARFAQHSINWLSRKWPGIPYPYEKTTVVQGYAGMEYPMMANDETYADTNFSRFVAEHEIAHTYMPFYMGINESRYAFMDEGWATFFELMMGREDMGNEQADALFKQFRVANWINDPSSDQDMPIVTPTSALTGPGRGNNDYGKAALGYVALKELLGDVLFKECLHSYIKTWNGKHPIPWDFFNIFSTTSKQDLNWFWNNWFFSHNYIDLAIHSAKKSGANYIVTIDNIGGMVAPFNVTLKMGGDKEKTIHYTPAQWKNNQKQVVVTIPVSGAVETVIVDGGIFMDANTGDNTLAVK